VTALAKIVRTTAFRLAMTILLLSAVGAGIVLGAVAWQVISVVDEEMTQTIEAEASGLSEQYDQGGIRRLGAVIDARTREPGSSLYLLTNAAGEPLAGNVAQLPAGVLDTPGFVDTPYETTDGAGTGRRALAHIYALPGGFRLLIGHDLRDRARIGGVMIRALAISLVFFAALAALGAAFVARRVLRRIDAMNTSARVIMAGDLTRRLPVSGSGDEIDRLAIGLNEMLARIGDLMAGVREVSDNIAHDLRTPLTRLRNHAEEALRGEGDAAAYRHALERTIEESDSLIKIFNALLLIARAEVGGDREAMQEFDVGAVAQSIAELYEPLAEEAGLSLEVDAAPGLRMRGMRELIGQTIANLVDNAIKYGTPQLALGDGERVKNEVSVSARREGASVVVSVADHGPGIAAADRPRVLDRFVRLEGARSRPGSGLGLSLAAAVARMHGGAVALGDNAPGLIVRVTLPAIDSAPALPAPLAVESR
jgi:signal transduction histidine kinase